MDARIVKAVGNVYFILLQIFIYHLQPPDVTLETILLHVHTLRKLALYRGLVMAPGHD